LFGIAPRRRRRSGCQWRAKVSEKPPLNSHADMILQDSHLSRKSTILNHRLLWPPVCCIAWRFSGDE
jgi:hypothetical protein